MPTWPEAFVRQAASDLATYNELSRASVATSHRLHYLQMWLEKLCKAYLWLPGGDDDLRMRHQVVGKVLPTLIAQHWRRIGFLVSPSMSVVRELCREVDLLHPQVDDAGRRPDNVEYPWRVDGVTFVPAEWTFSLAARLYSAPGKSLLKAATLLTHNPALFLPA